jgi:glycine/D-amino acid oxidase-like deaminating enzyme
MAVSRRGLLLGAGTGLLGAMVGAGGAIGFMSGKGWRQNNDVPRVLQVPMQEDLPAEADVVVIGAGIAGISTALFLNARGLKTVVLEKGLVAGEQSGRAFGWIYSNGWDLGKLQIANRSKEIWAGFAERFGEDVGFRRTGNYSLIGTEEEAAYYEGWLKEALAAHPQMDAKLIRGAELDALIPGASAKFVAGLYQGSDGTAEPQWSVPKIALGAQREGVVIVGPCAARSVEREGGKVAGVHTEKGYIRCKQVVIAGGAWSSLFASNLGVKLPQLSIATSMTRVSKVDGFLPGAGYGPDFTWRQAANGDTHIGVLGNVAPIMKDNFRFMMDFIPTLKATPPGMIKVRLSRDFFDDLAMPSSWANDEVSPFEMVRMLSGTVDQAEVDSVLANLRRAFPQYEKAVVKEQWAGVIDATPDSTQFVSAVPDNEGLFVITGFSGNGLTTAPASGEMLAQMMVGETPASDPSIYRFNRFEDGSEFVFRH